MKANAPRGNPVTLARAADFPVSGLGEPCSHPATPRSPQAALAVPACERVQMVDPRHRLGQTATRAFFRRPLPCQTHHEASVAYRRRILIRPERVLDEIWTPTKMPRGSHGASRHAPFHHQMDAGLYAPRCLQECMQSEMTQPIAWQVVAVGVTGRLLNFLRGRCASGRAR